MTVRAPQRTCVGCRRVRAKSELVRVVRGLDGSAAVDRGGHAPGRGAYVCPRAECVERARRRLGGALRANRIDFERITNDLVSVVN